MSIIRFFWTGIDSLAFYDQRTFAKYVGATFQVRAGDDEDVVAFTLESVTDILPADADRMNGREFFHLQFETGVDHEAWAAGVYVLEHRDLGAFRLLLTPRRTHLFQVGDLSGEGDVEPVVVSTNAHLYRAIVYRLAYSAMGSQEAQSADWPVHASRFNADSSLSTVPPVSGELVDDEAVFEEGYGPQGEE